MLNFKRSLLPVSPLLVLDAALLGSKGVSEKIMADRRGRASTGHSNGHHHETQHRPPAPAIHNSLTSLVGGQAASAARQLRDRGQYLLGERKSRVARQLADFGTAIKRAADTLEDREGKAVAQYVAAAADRVDSAARYLDGHDITEVTQQIGELARRRPAVAFAGLFLAGVATARLMRAARAATSEMDTSGMATTRGAPSRR